MRSLLPLLTLALAILVPISISANQHHHKHHSHPTPSTHKANAIPRASRPVTLVNPRDHTITDPQQPQQIIVSLTNTTGEVMVSWLQFAPNANPTLNWNLTKGNGPTWMAKLPASAHSWTDPHNPTLIRYMYQVKITHLTPSTTYYYRVGDATKNNEIWSETLSFVTIPPADKIMRLAVYGDFGLYNSSSIETLRDEVLHKNGLDAILHVGDFAYDLHTDDGSIGDAWLNSMQSITSHIPYMGCAGNHEGKYNLTHYTERFALWKEAGKQTKSGNNWWFSWDYQSGGATVHMVAINTEMYYAYVDEFNNGTIDLYPEQRKIQYEWLDTDLASARARNVDWLIVYGHRPMYCSNVDDLPDCSTDAQQLREGYLNKQGVREYGMEELLGKYNVDIYFTAHEHSYERTYPVLKGKFEIHPQNDTYMNPKMPVHIVTGSAGCQEFFDYYDNVFYGPWSVVRSSTYGYGHLLVHNKTHLYWDQLLAEGEQGRDVMWIVHQAEPTDPPTHGPTQGPTLPPSDDSSGVSKGAAGGIVGGIIVSLIIGWCLWTTWYNKQVKATQFNTAPSTTVVHDERRDPLLLSHSAA